MTKWLLHVPRSPISRGSKDISLVKQARDGDASILFFIGSRASSETLLDFDDSGQRKATMATKLTQTQLALFPESKQHSITAALVVFLIFGNISVILRIISQIRVHRRIFAEDEWISLAVVWHHRCLHEVVWSIIVQIFSNIVIACYLVGRSLKCLS